MKNNDQRSSLLWLAVGLAIVYSSTKYGLGMLSSPGPGFVPFLAGLAVAALALVVFFQQLGKKRRENVTDLFRQKDWPAMLKVMVALVLYSVFLKSLGFVLVTFCLTAYLFRIIEPMAWKKVFAGAFLTALGAYVVFNLWLEAQLPAGMFGF